MEQICLFPNAVADGFLILIRHSFFFSGEKPNSKSVASATAKAPQSPPFDSFTKPELLSLKKIYLENLLYNIGLLQNSTTSS